MKTRITFLRHGTTQHNTEHIYSGVLDPPLDGAGEAMAENAAQLIKEDVFDVMLYGYMKRVEQTAQFALHAFNKKPELILQLPEIHELNFGVFEGLTREQIEALYPAEWAAYNADMINYVFPSGDSIRDFYRNCEDFSAQVLEEYAGKSVLIVAHKGFILACAAAMSGEGIGGMYTRDILHAHTLTLDIE